VKGLKAAYASIGASQRGQYSWVAKLDDHYVYTAEIDHLDKKNNAYNHIAGVFKKTVPPMSPASGHQPISIRHSMDLFEAATDSYEKKLKCRVMLVKGTKYGKTKGGISAAAEEHYWQVTELSGSVDSGYEFTLERVE